MKLARTLLFGLLLGLPLVLGGCLDFRFPVVGWIYLIYYPQEPRVCPEGVLVTLELPTDAENFSVSYRTGGGYDERVPMLAATSFLMTKPAKAPATPEEAETWEGRQEWDGFYMVGIRFDGGGGYVGVNFYCQGSGRAVGEHTTTKEANSSRFIVIENPSRESGLEVRPVR